MARLVVRRSAVVPCSTLTAVGVQCPTAASVCTAACTVLLYIVRVLQLLQRPLSGSEAGGCEGPLSRASAPPPLRPPLNSQRHRFIFYVPAAARILLRGPARALSRRALPLLWTPGVVLDHCRLQVGALRCASTHGLLLHHAVPLHVPILFSAGPPPRRPSAARRRGIDKRSSRMMRMMMLSLRP